MNQITGIINEHIGALGRMLSQMKREPKGHVCVWNGNIIVGDRKVWFGDIDLTKDAKNLQKCADEIGQPLYILREMDARFDKEKNPDLTKAVTVINPSKV